MELLRRFELWRLDRLDALALRPLAPRALVFRALALRPLLDVFARVLRVPDAFAFRVPLLLLALLRLPLLPLLVLRLLLDPLALWLRVLPRLAA